MSSQITLWMLFVPLGALTTYLLYRNAKNNFPQNFRSKSELLVCGFLTSFVLTLAMFPQVTPLWLLCVRFLISVGVGLHLAYVAPLQWKRVKP